MAEDHWEECQYYAAGNCPESLQILIDRAYLLPQLLDSSQIEAAKEACQNCEKLERREAPRIEKPLSVVISKNGVNTISEGTIVNVSEGGALIKLEDWANFRKDQTIEFKICYADKSSDQANSIVLNGSAVVKRIARKNQELGIMFLDTVEYE